jgi:L-asparaginase / beta-aspartyl-peptidase
MASPTERSFGIVIHGGAGTVSRELMTLAREDEFRAALTEALTAGHDVLRTGGSALDAVCAAVVVLEDSPLFNAGRGAVFNAAGEIELDASIMDGRTLGAGAVAAARTPKNPVLAARAVMECTDHVMLAGAGADAFAKAQGLAVMPPEYFFTQNRWDALQKEQARIREGRPLSDASQEQIHGTVGAVALDTHGNLAAATSTGGRSNKMVGRVGDTPVIGGGTYAANDACAVSATGHGEYFTRLAVAHEIVARMRLAGQSLAEATDEVVLKQVAAIGGSGGVIAIDARGNIAMPFNTEGMYRGWADAEGVRMTGIFLR